METIIRVGIHGHPGHDPGPGACGLCEAVDVRRSGDVWLSADNGQDLGEFAVCEPCLRALWGLSHLQDTNGTLLKLERLR
jgi:hypothetical protein